MKQSQIVVLSMVGVLAGVMVLVAGLGRTAMADIDPDDQLIGDGLLEKSELTGFNRIKVEGDWQVTVTRGEEWTVKLTDADDVKVYTVSERLRLKQKTRWWGGTSDTAKAEIIMPELKALNIAGAGDFSVSGFEGTHFEVDVAGAVQLVGRDGRYDSLKLSSAGASNIDLQGVVVTDAQVDVAGASEVTLDMNGGELVGSIAGAGNIEYYGTVSAQQVDIAGMGSVQPVESNDN